MKELAAYAARESNSRGRRHEEAPPAFRGEYQRDRDRIVHCGAFRRLEYKTQVFVNHEGDMFRTRLTHSMEVAQLARTVARVLHINEDLTEAIALAHDLGHTPFGHAGQDELNACMREHGGFEHNLQSLRVVDVLEHRYINFVGLNLTFESREGILKHCSRSKAHELGELGSRFLQRKQPSLEAQVADITDSIAYNNHDIDDGLRAGLITIDQLRELEIFRLHHDQVVKERNDLDIRQLRYEVIRRIINQQVTDLITTSRIALDKHAPEHVEEVRDASVAFIGFSEPMMHRHRELKTFLGKYVYKHYRVRRMSKKAKRIIGQLFEALVEDPLLLPDNTRDKLAELENDDPRSGRARGVADYIAGMTDRFAIAEFERIYNPTELT